MQAAFRHTNQDVFLWRDHSTVGCFCCKFCTTENTAPDPRPYFPACILRMFSRCLRTQVFVRPRPHCRVCFFHWEGMASSTLWSWLVSIAISQAHAFPHTFSLSQHLQFCIPMHIHMDGEQSRDKGGSSKRKIKKKFHVSSIYAMHEQHQVCMTLSALVPLEGVDR